MLFNTLCLAGAAARADASLLTPLFTLLAAVARSRGAVTPAGGGGAEALQQQQNGGADGAGADARGGAALAVYFHLKARPDDRRDSRVV